MAKHDPRGHWRRTRLLVICVLTIWAVVALILPYFMSASGGGLLDGVAGYVFAAEGIVIFSVALVFWFAHRQQVIDREFAMAEED